MLMKAMSNLHMGKQLSPTERDVLAKYMHNMTDIMLKDDTVFNRAKLHTQKTKYQTEESTVDLDEKMVDGVEIVDGPEEEIKQDRKKKKKDKEDNDYDDKGDMKENVDPDDEERMRKKEENKARRLSVRKRDKYRMLPAEVKKQRQKAGLDEDVAKINEDYKAMFEAALECYEIDNIRDLPEESKAEFFKLVDAALEEAKMAKKDHDGDGKVETSTAEYMGSRDKAIKKATKPSWDSKQARANALDSLDKKAQARQDMKKEEFILDEDDLVVVIDEEMTTGYRPDMGHSGTQGTVNLGGKEHSARKVPIKHYDEFKKKHPGSKVMFRGPRDGMGKEMHTRKDNANHFYIVHKKKMKEEVELTFEEMTPQQKAARMKMIANSQKRVDSGDAARDAEKRAAKAAKADMKQKGSQKGMAPTKKDVVYDKDDKRGSVVEDIQQLRKVIKEGSAKEKIEAYKELNQIIEQYKTTGEL